jgi:zinc transport system substrate-binding protein
MIKKLTLSAVLFLALIFALAAEGTAENETETDSTKKVQVFVSILPQKGVVERIGGTGVAVEALVKPGESPHTFEPSPKQVMAIGSADALFTLGFPFEKRLVGKLASSDGAVTLFSMDRGITRRHLQEHRHEEGEQDAHQDHSDDDDNEEGHEHEGMPDPHVWLGPPQLERLARNTYEGLAEVDPANRDQYKKNLDAYLEELHRIDSQISEVMAPYRGRSVLVFHPAFGYFCDHYGIDQLHIEIEGKSPTPRQLESLIAKAREENIRIIFVQPQFDKKSAQAVAEAIDGTVVPLNPLHEHVLQNLEIIAEKVEEALR